MFVRLLDNPKPATPKMTVDGGVKTGRDDQWCDCIPMGKTDRQKSPQDMFFDHIEPAMRRLVAQLPKDIPVSLDLMERPKGLQAVVMDTYCGWQMRMVVDQLPAERFVFATGERGRWYNVGTDEFEVTDLVPCIRFDVRRIEPLD